MTLLSWKLAFKGLLQARGGRSAVAQTLLINVVIQATNVGTGIVTARALMPTGRGDLAAISTWPQFIAYCVTLGIPTSLVYNLRKYPASEDKLFTSALICTGLLGIVASLIGMCIVPLWLTQYSPSVVRAAQVAMLVAPVALVGTVLTSTLQARGDFAMYNTCRYLSPIISLGWLLALKWLHFLTPGSAAVATLIPGALVLLIPIQHLFSKYKIDISDFGRSFARLAGYGLKVYGTDLLGTVAGQIDRVLVIGMLTPTAMGMYVVALSASRLLNVLQGSVTTVLFVKAAGKPVEEVVEIVGRAVRITTIATVICGLVAAMVAPFLLSRVYGPGFAEAVPVLRILLGDAAIIGIAWVLAQAFMAVGRPGMVALLQGVGIAVAVPLLWVLVPRYGITGAAVALILSSTLRLVFVLSCYPVILGVRVPRLMPRFREDFKWAVLRSAQA